MGSITLPKDLFQHVLYANKPGFAEKFSLHVIAVSEVCILVFRQDYVRHAELLLTLHGKQ